MLRIDVHRTILGIVRTEWDSCFQGDPEGWAYYRAVEEAELADFSWVYFAARECDRLIAVAPAFITDYRLDTTIQGRCKVLLQPLMRRVQRLLTLRLVCLGSPLADKCHLGFAPDLSNSRRSEVVDRLLASINAFAASHGIGLVAAKDIAEDHVVGIAFVKAGFTRQPSLPNAVLQLPYATEDAYLKSLPRATRRDVRRKLKTGDLVQIDRRHGKEALCAVPAMVGLYENQRNRSSVGFEQFEALTPAYFRRVLIELADAAVVFLYLHQGRLAGFNLCYHTDRLFIDKFIGVELPLARTLNLYVLSWMTNVRYCLARDIPFLQTGQTGYSMKRRLGSELLPSWIFFRHRNPIYNSALRVASPLLAADRYDEDLSRRSGREA